MKAPVSDAAIQAIAEAIFKERPLAVVEAYSVFGQELRTFRSPEEFCAYVMARRDSLDGSAHVAVHYPDMAGKLAQTRVSLDRRKCNGYAYRYRAEGWGLVWVYLQLRPANPDSFISANSEKRALAWAATLPELDPPTTWDWPAVGRHLRRLRRVLKLAA
jgi:hypothetical protein